MYTITTNPGDRVEGYTNFLWTVLLAAFYAIGGGINEMTPGSFPQAFFFSVETLATVGYGHNYPATLYGHVMVTIEIFIGTIWFAVITGLIFVRFSRPTARILFSKSVLIGNHNGRPTVMFRVANLRHTSMVDAQFSLLLSRDEIVLEGEEIRLHTGNLLGERAPSGETLRGAEARERMEIERRARRFRGDRARVGVARSLFIPRHDGYPR